MLKQPPDSVHITEIIKKHQGNLLKFISKRMINNANESEDILQEVWLQLITACNFTAGDEKGIVSWLYIVARNKIIDFYRKKKACSLSAVMISASGAILENSNEPWSYDTDVTFDDAFLDLLSPEEILCNKELSDNIDKAMQDVPENLLHVFVQNEIEGKAFKDIANETGVSINTLLSQKAYAKKHLQKKLKVAYENLCNN